MKYGIYVPNFGKAISAQSLADLAQNAEKSGWDGFFIWDHILHSRCYLVA
jgi:alkanesulfonate monooxygenase SsuD/methylene tetrahydromethanopterin reductase-like flavin-dependent oxidoreductase (luciferase family)